MIIITIHKTIKRLWPYDFPIDIRNLFLAVPLCFVFIINMLLFSTFIGSEYPKSFTYTQGTFEWLVRRVYY